MFLISSCICLWLIHWSQVLSREGRCSWSSADRRCSNYIWVINNFIAYWGMAYIGGLTVYWIALLGYPAVFIKILFTKWKCHMVGSRICIFVCYITFINYSCVELLLKKANMLLQFMWFVNIQCAQFTKIHSLLIVASKHKTWSILVQVLACYLNQCWLIVSVFWFEFHWNFSLISLRVHI